MGKSAVAPQPRSDHRGEAKTQTHGTGYITRNLYSHKHLPSFRNEIAGREATVLEAWGVSPPVRGHMRCPFPDHEDRRPSWRFDFRQGRYHCSCGSGDLVDIARRMLGCDEREAIASIRRTLGLPLPGLDRTEAPEERLARLTGARARAEAARAARGEQRRQKAVQQLAKVLAMSDRAVSARRSPVEAYLASRGLMLPPNAVLQFLPPAKPNHHPAMICLAGLPVEIGPGRLHMPAENIRGAHLTLLKPDGSGKADVESPKIILGLDFTEPFVVAPVGDQLGLLIAEGIEDTLSAHQRIGLGAWAAGTANRLPGLARHIPACIETVTILQDDDQAGRHFSRELAGALVDCDAEIRILALEELLHG